MAGSKIWQIIVNQKIQSISKQSPLISEVKKVEDMQYNKNLKILVLNFSLYIIIAHIFSISHLNYHQWAEPILDFYIPSYIIL
jgi:hypothetical protein